MKDPATLQNAKMGLGVPIFEQLREKQAQFEPQQQPQAQPAEPQKQEPEKAPQGPVV